MSIKLNKILPPANELFDKEELEKIFLQAIELTSRVEEEFFKDFTSVIINKEQLDEHYAENEQLIKFLKEINTDEIVKRVTMHYSEASPKHIDLKSDEYYAENEQLIKFLKEINTDEIVKRVTMQYSETSPKHIDSKNIEASVTFAESEFSNFGKYNLEGAA